LAISSSCYVFTALTDASSEQGLGDLNELPAQRSDTLSEQGLGDLHKSPEQRSNDPPNLKRGFEFMGPLVADMCQDDPAKRPKMSEVVVRFYDLAQNLSSWKLRSRVVGVGDNGIAKIFHSIPHWGRRLKYVARRVPPVPSPFSNGKSYFLRISSNGHAHFIQ
jgi:hypothetical protein